MGRGPLKCFTLDSGTEEGWNWRCSAEIYPTEGFCNKGRFLAPRNNAEEYQKYKQSWRQTEKGKEYIRKKVKEYRETEKGRKVARKIGIKMQAKRRGLGFIPINTPFDGSEGHHLDSHFVVYIPKELHQSIRHNVWNGEGMNEINMLSFEWMREIGGLN